MAGRATRPRCVRWSTPAPNLTLSDREGRTPLQLARSRGFDAMVRILEAGPQR